VLILPSWFDIIIMQIESISEDLFIRRRSIEKESMDDITQVMKDKYALAFEQHGATAKGVDWNDENELLFRYDKMLAVMQKDFAVLAEPVSMLDVGCGWGGLLRRARSLGAVLHYSGIDVVLKMIQHAREEFPGVTFIHGDVFDLDDKNGYDFVICNAILTQKYDISLPEMEKHTKRLVRKMFELCRHGIAFNMMSTRVNFMVENLYYQNPADLLTWLLAEISPRVRLDHGYSSLANEKGKFFDFTIYAYKD
jgi:2-polyprenyl-3-methyl-5-hydroxy-6-metoxy-1,4-benzoquinol methylase